MAVRHVDDVAQVVEADIVVGVLAVPTAAAQDSPTTWSTRA